KNCIVQVELIRYWNYPVEEYDIVTQDGYILSMVRIPRGRHASNSSFCHRTPILFAHGLGADGAEFVMNPPESSPGMILADEGFDVFIFNHRGTTHSRRHLRLTSNDNEFWKFTLDELAKFDATAAIDKALELNGAKSLYWIGHSQGSLVGFLLLSGSPSYNSK
ncbi:hypothetical protein PFISCL1PPCAC_14526, partial [Pristionchus fissidentatus]